MSLTAMRLLESARRKFFMTRRTSCPQSRIQTSFGIIEGEMSPTAMNLLRIGEKKIFHELDVHHV